jgi:diacylglycerol kinase
VKEFLKSFIYALRGLKASLKEQRNLKVQVLIVMITIAAGFYLDITSVEWCLIFLCAGLVIGLELVNTSIENLVDLVTRKRIPLAGKIKDIAAGAVLVASIIAVVIGVIVFRKYLV